MTPGLRLQASEDLFRVHLASWLGVARITWMIRQHWVWARICHISPGKSGIEIEENTSHSRECIQIYARNLANAIAVSAGARIY